MSKLLIDTMNTVTEIGVALEKSYLLASNIYDMATPNDKNKSESEQAYNALFIQKDLSTTGAMLIDYLCELKEKITELEKSLDEEFERRKAEEKE